MEVSEKLELGNDNSGTVFFALFETLHDLFACIFLTLSLQKMVKKWPFLKLRRISRS
jgi:hypothetical protein